jgi:Rieske Fe-S protein
MEEKMEGVFTIMYNQTFTFLFSAFFLFCTCKDDPMESNPVNPAPVNLTINTDLPSYFHLKNMGGFIYESGGNKGILLIHAYDDNFYALDRACTYNPDWACSLINVDTTRLNLRCGTYDTVWRPCCDSRFQYDGNVIKGPAKYPLRAYPITISGSILYVRN